METETPPWNAEGAGEAHEAGGGGGQRQVLARGQEDGELSSGLGGWGGTGDLSRSYFGGRWGPWPRRRGSGSERARSLARAVEGGQGPEARALRH